MAYSPSSFPALSHSPGYFRPSYSTFFCSTHQDGQETDQEAFLATLRAMAPDLLVVWVTFASEATAALLQQELKIQPRARVMRLQDTVTSGEKKFAADVVAAFKGMLAIASRSRSE